MENEAVHRTIISLDVEGSSQLTNPEKLAMRSLYERVVRNAFEVARIHTSKCRLEDRGDGQLGVIHADVAKARILGPWLAAIDRGLRYSNGTGDVVPIRLRVGVHAGEVHHDANGIAGSDVDLACRLVDASVGKAALAAAHGACVVVVVSDVIYQTVVRHGGQFIIPGHYLQIPIMHKETNVSAWITVPGYSVPPVPADILRHATTSQPGKSDGHRVAAPQMDAGAQVVNMSNNNFSGEVQVGHRYGI